MMEAIAAAESIIGRKLDVTYHDDNRKGDHICYISDMTKFRAHYPEWSISKSLDDIYGELARGSAV
jgi:CDP-paratose 2-epimerase